MAAAKNARRGRWKDPMGKLHVLLTKAFPEHQTKSYAVLDIAWLAAKLKVTDEAVYKWLRDDQLPSLARARAICAIRGCRLKLDDLLPFVA